MPCGKEEVTYLYSEAHGYLYMREKYNPWGEYHEYSLRKVDDDVLVKVLAKDLRIISGGIGDKIIEELEYKRNKIVKDRAIEKALKYCAENLTDGQVGLIGKEVVVFDKNVNFPNISCYIFWNVNQGTFIRIKKDCVKGRIAKSGDANVIRAAIDNYKNWIASIDKVFTPRLFVINELLSEDERAEALLVDKHQEFMTGLGIKKPSVYVRGAFGRNTHCWRCKDALSTNSHLACPSCNGLICACGACLCGMNRL